MYIKNKKNTISDDESINETILINWIDAMYNFYMYHNELVTCINEQRFNKVKKIYIGQCPSKQLVNLVNKMQSELEKLLQDVGNPQTIGNRSDKENNQEKLAAHTSTLNRLNQEALTSLLLTTRIAS